MDIPDQITTETIVSYNAPVGCDIASKASQFLKVKLESSIQCAQNKTCIVAVEAKGKYKYKPKKFLKYTIVNNKSTNMWQCFCF